MTLIVAAGCRDHALITVDRRLTREGHLVDDESNKLVVLASPALRLGVAYTGVARAGTFSTAEWLPELLRSSLRSNGTLDLDAFCERASADFSHLHAHDPMDLLLALGMVGFTLVPDSAEPHLMQVLVGNEVQQPGAARPRLGPFSWEGGAYPANWDDSFAVMGGAIAREHAPYVRQLRTLAARGGPSPALRLKAVEVIQRIARGDPRVGGQCSSLAVDRSGDMVFDYHTARPTTAIYSPTVVTPGQVFLGVKIQRLGAGAMAVPRVHKSAPCPCGSRKRYARCHARSISRGTKPRFDFTLAGSVHFVVGDTALTDDTQAMTVIVPERTTKVVRASTP